jgi:hypothetical protein
MPRWRLGQPPERAQTERRLQHALLTGPPPLGPGASPAERLSAFYGAMVDLLDQHLDLALAAETGPARFRAGAYGFWLAHVHVLRAAGVADRGDILAELVLAPLSGELYRRLSDRGASRSDIRAAFDPLARRVLATTAPPRAGSTLAGW